MHRTDRPTLPITRPLTDAELRAADAATRRWYLRVLTLMQLTGCSFALALRAVEANDDCAATPESSH